MEKKKIVININESGELDAETFGMVGVQCMEELDKLMKDITNSNTKTIRKDDYYKQKTLENNKVINKNA